MKNDFYDAYRRLHRSEKQIFVLSAAVIVLFLVIRWKEDTPLWVMILAVICALADGLLVIHVSHQKEKLSAQLKERKDTDE
jgi:Ca2+/H+ antiporter